MKFVLRDRDASFTAAFDWQLLQAYSRVVVKPMGGAGSQGVRVLESARDLRQLTGSGSIADMEVEEFIARAA